jgi:signal transduction histidine kinase
MKRIKKIVKLVPKRLIATTILMALILVLIVVFIISLISEKSRIQSALDLSQRNREQILRTENVTESLVVVEARFKEYCTTFEKPVFEEYQKQAKTLVQNINLLQQTFDEKQTLSSGKIIKIFDDKTKEANIYMKLRLITDSLIFSVGSFQDNQTELGKYIGSQFVLKVDTLSVTETRETYKKGLLGKLKSALVGEKEKQNVNTKLRVQSGNSLDKNDIRQAMIRALQANKVSANAPNFNELVRKTVELKESELKLIEISNRLIGQIQQLIEEIKTSIREQEAKYNNIFLKSVRHSTDFLQNILIVLMILAFALAIYILLLAYRNVKFQDNIISLNDKIMKDSIEKDKFYSIISHDIVNPFNALLGFSKILKDAVKEGDQKEIEECSTIVHQSANRISNLLQNLLVWSRMQNGKMNFSPKSCNINKLVSETIAIITPIAKNKDINLAWDVKGEIKTEIDQNMISSVLQNLTTNSIKFTNRGGEVKISAFTESDKLIFIVSDTGVGMNEEQLQKLFRLDKTSSLRGTDEETGTGLGLIICKEFIEKHHGNIWVESTLGKGSNFCFSIPLS